MTTRVRQADIAERLGITTVSVSKALRAHSDISEETRLLVEKTAAEMGYSPNLVARSLSSKRSYTLGVVVPKIAHTFFASVLDAIQERATTEGYGIVLAVSNESAALERQHIERLMAMRVDGLLVSVSQEPSDLEVYRRVRAMQLPLVFFDRQIEGLGFSSVTVDDRGGACAAVEYAIEQGATRIAHFAGSETSTIGRDRRAGYEQALRRHGLPVRDAWIIPGGFDEGHGYRAFMQLLEQDELPEIIFSVTFPVGLGARGAMRERAPELLSEIEIIDFGDHGLNALHRFPHVYVRQPTAEIGAAAVEVLLDEINAKAPPEPRHVVLGTQVELEGQRDGTGGAE